MAWTLLPFLSRALVWLGRAGIAIFLLDEVRKLTTGDKETIARATAEAGEVGLDENAIKELVAGTTYEMVEKAGKSPDDFWDGLSPAEQEHLKFSPSSLRTSMGRTTFLGLAQTLLWLSAGIAAGYGAFKGLPVTLSGLSRISAIPRNARNATAISNELQLMKTAVLNKVWVPGTIAGIASVGGWLTGAMTNNMNDALLWGRIFLGQAHSDVQKAYEQAGGDYKIKATSLNIAKMPKTIIRMVEEKKPEQFLGTLFSAKLGEHKEFLREVDEEITDEADLVADIKVNLNRWLVSLVGRLGYSVVIRKNPVDEYGVQQSGTWATLTLHMTRLSGPIQPIDTILLGPVSPTTRLKLSKTLKTVEHQIPDMLVGQKVIEIEIPSGVTDMFDEAGERVDLSTIMAPPKVITTTQTTTPTTRAREEMPAEAVKITPPVVEEKTAVEEIIEEYASGPMTKIPKAYPAPPKPPEKPKWEPYRLALGRYAVVSTGTGEGLNLRKAPSLSGEILLSIPDGSGVSVAQSGGKVDGYNWRNVRYGNRDGWVAEQFLSWRVMKPKDIK